MLLVANAQGFWGDSPDAAYNLIKENPNIDYLTLDYLAEVSLSIMAIQREKDPALGYARDFLEVIKSLIPLWENGWNGTVITNAGGLNPKACAKALSESSLKIAVVTGDDVLKELKKDPKNPNYTNLDSDKSLNTIQNNLVTANAYVGAIPIAKVLEKKPQIVITGRVADPSLTVAPCLFHYNWSIEDYDKLAGATVAGHLIECGRQVTGGISTDWLKIPSIENIGFPIAEIDEDGSCTITKSPNSGGIINRQTVTEQLLYEIGDPSAYLSPDVTVSFLELAVEELAPNRVRVSGAKGFSPPLKLKVNATYRDGFRSEAMLTLFGSDLKEKARKTAETILSLIQPTRYHVECIGAGDLVPGTFSSTNFHECMLRITVADSNEEVVKRFTREIASMVTAGPQGITGYSSGRPKVRPIFGFWPCLIDRSLVTTEVSP